METDRGGKSTYHARARLVCYPILDLNRHGRDVKRYVRDLEAVIRTLAAHTIEGERIEEPDRRLTLLASKSLLSRRPRIAVGDDAAMRSTSTSIRRRSRTGSPACSLEMPRSRRWRGAGAPHHRG